MEQNATKLGNNLNKTELTTSNITETVILGTINSMINETINIVYNTTENSVQSVKNNILTSKLAENEDKVFGGDRYSTFEEVWLWIFGIYCGNIALGIVFNGISFVSLLKTKRNGTLSIITQLTSIDIYSSWVCIIELLTIKQNAWTFTPSLCPFFSGSETLCNTLTLYLMISLNYHTISLCNLKTPPTSSCDASQECLVRDNRDGQNSSSTTSTTSTSSTISKSQNGQKRDISVFIPCILIWFTCISLSIPQFTLSSIVDNYSTKNITSTCTLLINDSKILINLLTIFRVFIPITLVVISVSILMFKLLKSVRNDSIPSIFTKKCHNIVYYLIFCLVLNISYVFTSMQRLVLYAMQAYVSPSSKLSRIYKLPPLFNDFTGVWVSIALCMLHYSGIFLRFLVYVCLLPKFKSILCNNFLTCFKPKEL